MPWLRLDDTFDTHPKIVALATDERRWTWMRVLLYTTRHRTNLIPHGIRDIIPKATPAFLKDCVNIGLIDLDDDGMMRVHDWDDYNGPDSKLQVRDRVRRYREKRESNAGGNAEVTGDVTPTALPNRDSRADACARPVPNPKSTPSSSSMDARARLAQALDDDDLETATTHLGLTPDQHARALDSLRHEPDRVRAAMEAALANGAKLAPYVDEILRNGSWPEPAAVPKGRRAPDPTAVCSDCGEKLGHGHLETCPRMASADLDDGEPEPAVGEARA